MQTLELKDEIFAQLQQVAGKAQISTNELIEHLLTKYTSEQKELATLNNYIGLLKDSPTFKSDPIAKQKK